TACVWWSLCRTIDSVLIGYAKGTITCFFGDLDIIMDVVRSRLGTKLPPTYPLAIHTFFFGYYRSETNLMMQVPGDMVVNAMMATMAAHAKQQAEFIYHMGSSVRSPVSYATLEHCGFRYFLANPRVRRDGSVIQTRRLPFIKSMVGFRVFMTLRYKLPLEVSPFDDLNMERLRMAMKKDDVEAKMFDFDPKHIDWEDYFSSIHIPGVMKYAFK
ncbi:hypothetical protein BHE74_00042702, partial [Ensete ventricosum]